MLVLSDMLNSVRKSSIEWHCHEIIISQESLKDGFKATGYGVIKSDERGGLYLEFICLKASSRIEPRSFIPEDSLDKSQKLTMRAKKIDGVDIVSKGFVLEGNVYTYIGQGPKIFSIKLSRVEISQKCKKRDDSTSLLTLEFKGRPNIPTNVVNSTKSSLGTKSSSWNETKLTYLSSEVRIIVHSDYTEIIIKGPSEEVQAVRKAVVFYINFSSGLYVQPYFESVEELELAKIEFTSVDASKVNVSISAPLSGSVYDAETNERYDQNHFDLFYKVCDLIAEKPKYFRSISSQWHRIWHAFTSYEMSVPMLTISVAVEGILSDIFIPMISEDLHDESFEQEKKRVCLQVEKVAELSKDNVSDIKRYIEKWGNVHPKRALIYLKDKGVIDQYHIRNWVSLRNSAAHPKLTKLDEARERKNLDRMYICLGLFYRLALNVFAYSGPKYAFENSAEYKIIVQEHIQVLK